MVFGYYHLVTYIFVMVCMLGVRPEELFGQFVMDQGNRLVGSVIYEKDVQGLIECLEWCLTQRYPSCKSFNLESKGKNNQITRCQLNKATKMSKYNTLLPDNTFNYWHPSDENLGCVTDKACQNNLCHYNATCISNNGSYLCKCDPGFTGNGTNCAEINEYFSTPCHHNATCIDKLNSCLCTCNPGFIGDGINCTEIDECLTNPCHPNTFCIDKVNSYLCKCSTGFVGNGSTCRVPLNCAELYSLGGERRDGVYTIKPDDLAAFQVRCDMTTDSGGWTIFQKRQDGSQNFSLGWNNYIDGFGNVTGEYWLGLDKLHRLTTPYSVLRFDLGDFDGYTAYAKYNTFNVAGETQKYNLTVGSYSGDAGDSFSYQNGMMFSTADSDNDMWAFGSCAVQFKGAWWYKACQFSNLNALYYTSPQTVSADGVYWKAWRGNLYSLKTTEMKIRHQHI